jgi:hypothetical protein
MTLSQTTIKLPGNHYSEPCFTSELNYTTRSRTLPGGFILNHSTRTNNSPNAHSKTTSISVNRLPSHEPITLTTIQKSALSPNTMSQILLRCITKNQTQQQSVPHPYSKFNSASMNKTLQHISNSIFYFSQPTSTVVS